MLLGASMIRLLAIGVLSALVPLAEAQEKPKEAKEPSPSEVVKTWMDSLAKRDMKAVAKLASKSYSKNGLEALAQHAIGYQGLKVETKIIHEEINGDSAVVVYRVQHGAAITYCMELLVKEGGAWRVSQQGAEVLLKLGK